MRNLIGKVGGVIGLAVASVLLASCGGGDGSSPTAPAAAAAQTMGLAPGLSAQEAAEDLMDVAEVRYYPYFKGHATTQSSGPFAYRYYPITGVYLGVVVADGTQYQLNGVYVMGGAFGAAPTYVGPLTAFLNPVDLTSTGTDNGCDSPSDYASSGMRIVVARAYSSGSFVGTRTTDSTVGAMTTFQGYPTREVDITVTSTTQAGATATTAIKTYSNVIGDGEVTSYGSTSRNTALSQSSGWTIVSTIDTAWIPPFVDRQYRLATGQSVAQTQTWTGVYTVSYSGSGAPGPSTSTNTTTLRTITTYVGRETITVPAGTYETCKYEVITPGTSSTAGSPYLLGSIQTSWTIVGTGIQVQSTSSSPASTTPGSAFQATSVMRAGQVL